MKKFILVLSLALMIGCKAQVQKQEVQVDPVLFKTVVEFLNEAREYGVDTSAIKDSLLYITVLPLDQSLYGIYTPHTKQVSINMFVVLDTIIMKKVIYHELGHVLGMKHEDNGIMQTNLNPEQLHQRYCTNENPSGSSKWELHKVMLFRKIRESQ